MFQDKGAVRKFWGRRPVKCPWTETQALSVCSRLRRANLIRSKGELEGLELSVAQLCFRRPLLDIMWGAHRRERPR